MEPEHDKKFENDSVDTFQTPEKSLLVPSQVGMEFASYDDAYDFYNMYAKDLVLG